jgi:hypothetical protein
MKAFDEVHELHNSAKTISITPRITDHQEIVILVSALQGFQEVSEFPETQNPGNSETPTLVIVAVDFFWWVSLISVGFGISTKQFLSRFWLQRRWVFRFPVSRILKSFFEVSKVLLRLKTKSTIS